MRKRKSKPAKHEGNEFLEQLPQFFNREVELAKEANTTDNPDTIETSSMDDHIKDKADTLETQVRNKEWLHFMEQLIKVNLIDTYTAFARLIRELMQLVQVNDVWNKEMTNIEQLFQARYLSVIDHVQLKEEQLMSSVFLEEIKEELLKLQPLQVETLDSTEQIQSAQAMMQEMQETIKKGNRVNLKLIQELQNKLDELILDKEEQTQAGHNEAIRQLTKLLLDVFDQLDLVYQAALNKQDENWSQDIQQIIAKALQLLDDYGLKEIEVEGKLFDGEYMEGLGTVSAEEVEGSVEKYQVYQVHQRGFQDKVTGQVIRRAKVITVY